MANAALKLRALVFAELWQLLEKLLAVYVSALLSCIVCPLSLSKCMTLTPFTISSALMLFGVCLVVFCSLSQSSRRLGQEALNRRVLFGALFKGGLTELLGAWFPTLLTTLPLRNEASNTALITELFFSDMLGVLAVPSVCDVVHHRRRGFSITCAIGFLPLLYIDDDDDVSKVSPSYSPVAFIRQGDVYKHLEPSFCPLLIRNGLIHQGPGVVPAYRLILRTLQQEQYEMQLSPSPLKI